MSTRYLAVSDNFMTIVVENMIDIIISLFNKDISVRKYYVNQFFMSSGIVTKVAEESKE